MSRRRITHITDLDNKSSPGPTQVITPTGSPYNFTAVNAGLLIVSGGTVTSIQYIRFGTAALIGLVAGQFMMARGDVIRITYVIAPTINFVPMILN